MKIQAFGVCTGYKQCQREFADKLKRLRRFTKIYLEYQPSSSRGHSLTACKAAPPEKSKVAVKGPKMADGVWKGVYP